MPRPDISPLPRRYTTARLGAEAASDLGFAASVPPMPPVGGGAPALATPLWWVHGGKGAAFVDLQNDVTTKDIELARLEGYGASEHVKRYTTLGMGTDQGKTAMSRRSACCRS